MPLLAHLYAPSLSTIVTGLSPLALWQEWLGEPAVTGAMLDRLLRSTLTEWR